MIFSPVQQHLFSYFNLAKVSSLKSLLEVLEEINSKLGTNESCTEEQLKAQIFQINKKIQKYELEIVEIIDELSCDKLYILINTADNVITQKSKFYDENTSQLFSKIVTNCILSEEGNVSETDCLNLSSQIKITKSAAQSILDKLMADKWLVSVNDRVSLGMRSIAELEQNIKQHYSDQIKNCPFCKLIVIQGYICENCRAKCHFACCKRYFRLSKSNCVCPNCKEVWNDLASHLNIGEADTPEQNSSCDAGPSRKKKKKSYM